MFYLVVVLCRYSFSLFWCESFLRVSSLGQDHCSCIIECWYFISLSLPFSKLRKLHLLSYFDVTQKSIVIILVFRLVRCVIYYVLLVW
jgi:hypothetical protein